MKPQLSTYVKDIESCFSTGKSTKWQHKSHDIAFELRFQIKFFLKEIEHINPKLREYKKVNNLCQDLFQTLEMIEKAAKRTKYVENSFEYASLVTELNLFLSDLKNFSQILSGHVKKDSKKFRPGKSNPHAIKICMIICRVYEKHLGRKPTLKDQSTIKQTGDLSAATAYEKLCYFVEGHLLSSSKIRLTHYAKKKAVGNYYKQTDITGLFGPQLVQKRKK